MSVLASPEKSRPQRPDVGPQAQYTLIGHSIGMSSDPCARFEDVRGDHSAGLEWTLFNLEKFDETSRYMILAGTAFHFGMPFDVLMGGML
jgi:hypothetical protein